MRIALFLLVILWICIQVEGKCQSFGKIGLWRNPSKGHSLGSTLIRATHLRAGEANDGIEEIDENESFDDVDAGDDSERKDGIFDDQKELVVNTISSIWNKTPPMTQIYVGSSIAATFLSFLLNKNVWPDFLHFRWSDILSGQLWRLGTAFLFFGQLDIFFPLTMQFVWQHMAQLEKLSYKKPEDFLVMVLFGGATLISVYTLLGISTKFLGHNLATYLVYIWSRVFEGSDVNFMDLAILKSEMLPWVFCAQTMLLEQELPLADLIGIAVGHLYYYLKNKDILKAPEAMRKWFQSDIVKAKYTQFKTDFE